MEVKIIMLVDNHHIMRFRSGSSGITDHVKYFSSRALTPFQEPFALPKLGMIGTQITSNLVHETRRLHDRRLQVESYADTIILYPHTV